MTLLALILAAQAAAPSDEAARGAIERSLPYLEREGVAWMEKRACLSCHHVPFLLWSHREARERGIAVDEKKLAAWTDWSLKESLAQRVKVRLAETALPSIPAELKPKVEPFTKRGWKEEEFAKAVSSAEFEPHRAELQKQLSREKGDGGGLDTMSDLLLAGGWGGDSDFSAWTRARIVELQQADGSWKPGGQLFALSRSAAEATEVTTMWTILALGDKSEVVTKALDFLKKAAPGKTNEGLALRMMVEKRFGTPELFRQQLKELAARQHPDGGWAWLQGDASSPFATGLILYLLSVAGSTDAVDLPRARQFLVGSQEKDGSWTIVGLHKSTKPEKLKSIDPIFRYWGTAWAAIGLARTLP